MILLFHSFKFLIQFKRSKIIKIKARLPITLSLNIEIVPIRLIMSSKFLI